MVGERFAASLERGRKTYLTYCISCHGPKGAGDGPVPQRGFPPPPSMLTGKSLQMEDGQLFHVLTYGQRSMAPFAAEVSRDRRWDVINYVRDLQSKTPSPTDSPSADAEARAPRKDAVAPATPLRYKGVTHGNSANCFITMPVDDTLRESGVNGT